jgi:hypothetical protein
MALQAMAKRQFCCYDHFSNLSYDFSARKQQKRLKKAATKELPGQKMNSRLFF